jgi:inhibitor of KinA sporulation pathway (predicted exonuclease)
MSEETLLLLRFRPRYALYFTRYVRDQKEFNFCSVISSLAQYTECRVDSAIAMECVADHLQVAEHQRSDSFMSKSVKSVI